MNPKDPPPRAPAEGKRDAEPETTRVLRPERAKPADILRPTRADIDLAAVRHNLGVVRREVPNAQIWGVVKADGYGHGAKALARTLERAGADGACVALLEEAVELREAGVQMPILVMGGDYGGAWEAVLRYRLTPVLSNPGQLSELAAEVRYRQAPRAQMHLQVDTGMARLGAMPSEIRRLGESLRHLPELELSGLMTHFACADAADVASVAHQLDLLDTATEDLRAARVVPPIRHAANSAALFRIPRARLDLVRPGLALFGIEPADGTAPNLRPAMSVHTRVVATRALQPGQSVGYGWTWTAPKASTIVTIPIGYADGLARNLSNRGEVLIHGKRCPIVGAVSMDLTMVDATAIPNVRLGDPCVILGSQTGRAGGDTITAREIANHLGTIPWEVLTSISRRVPRFYRGA